MTIPTSPDRVWFFGCITGAGHHAVPARGRLADGPWDPRMTPDAAQEVRDWMTSLDGCLHDEQSDRWLTHWFEAADLSQMTFIARRDREIDKRPGSWCGFLMPGHNPPAMALRVAREAFPDLTRIWSANP